MREKLPYLIDSVILQDVAHLEILLLHVGGCPSLYLTSNAAKTKVLNKIYNRN